MASFHRESFIMLATLGTTGFVSALALLAVASNRIPGILSEQVTMTLLLIQWHVTGLTLSKFGIDYALFAIASKHRDTTFRLRDVLAFPVLPCALGFFMASLFLFSPIAAGLLAIAVILDTLSTFTIAVLNAKRAFYAVSVGNLLNYPVFVFLLVGTAHFVPTLTIETVLLPFMLSSLLRYCWLTVRFSDIQKSATPISLTGKSRFGAQGALNLALFRSDQIMLAVTVFATNVLLIDLGELSKYLFLARFPEVATGVLVLVGTVFFPTYHFSDAGRTRREMRRSAVGRFYVFAACICLLVGMITIAIARYLFAGPLPPLAWCAPFALQIPLILLANLATYSMQSQGYVPVLLRNLAISVAAGAVVLSAAVATGSLYMLAWTVPSQLAIFITLFYIAPWGTSTTLFKVNV
jgi:hypothetical protein